MTESFAELFEQAEAQLDDLALALGQRAEGAQHVDAPIVDTVAAERAAGGRGVRHRTALHAGLPAVDAESTQPVGIR